MLKDFKKKIIRFLTLGRYELKNTKYIESLIFSITSLEQEKIKNKEQLETLNNSVTLLKKRQLLLAAKEKKLEKTLKLKDIEFDDLKKKAVDYVFPHPAADLFFHCLDSNQTKKKILLLGWYGANNLGDELMLTVMLKELCDSDNNEIAVILDKSERYKVKRKEKVAYYYAPTKIETLDNLADYFDVLIIGGGAHLDDNRIFSLNFIPYLSIELSQRFIVKRKLVKWLSVSSNNCLKDQEYITRLNFVVQNSAYFSVRDPYSLEALKSAGIDISRIKLEEDLAFKYPLRRKRLVLTLVPLSSKNLKELAALLFDFTQTSRENWSILCLPFCLQHNYDLETIEKFISYFRELGGDIEELPQIDNEEAIITLINGSDATINMRYHASLISLQLGKRTVSIVWDHPHYLNKMTYLNESSHVRNGLIQTKDLEISNREENLKILLSTFL